MEDFQSKYTGEQVEEMLDLIPNKVDKVSGKGLSAEDFTYAFKTKLEGLSNYDDTQIQAAITLLRNDFDKLVSGDTTTAIKTFNEIIAFLDGVNDTQSLSGIIASIEQQIAGKMDKVTLATVATSGSYKDLKDQPSIPAEQVNADWNATSGKARILNKPTIPAAVTESTVAGWGFTKNTGSYSKPSSGIPKSDLASAVQTSLGKADTALQQEQYKGTYSKPSSGIPKSDLASAVQTSLGKADTAVQPAAIANFADKTSYASQSGVTSATLQPNTFTDFGEVASLDVTLGSVASGAPLEKRMFGFQFTSGTTATTLTLPDTVSFPEDPTIEAGYTYQVTILNSRALITGWPNA
jgi:hypothetical protein